MRLCEATMLHDLGFFANLPSAGVSSSKPTAVCCVQAACNVNGASADVFHPAVRLAWKACGELHAESVAGRCEPVFMRETALPMRHGFAAGVLRD